MAYVDNVVTLPVTEIDLTGAIFHATYDSIQFSVNVETFWYYLYPYGWHTTGMVAAVAEAGPQSYSIESRYLRANKTYKYMAAVRDIRYNWHFGGQLSFFTKAPPEELHFRAWGKAGDGLIYTGEDNVLEWP